MKNDYYLRGVGAALAAGFLVVFAVFFWSFVLGVTHVWNTWEVALVASVAAYVGRRM